MTDTIKSNRWAKIQHRRKGIDELEERPEDVTSVQAGEKRVENTKDRLGDTEQGTKKRAHMCYWGLRGDCGRQTLTQSPRSPALACGQDLWVASNQRCVDVQRWWTVVSVNCVTLDCHIYQPALDQGWQLAHLGNSSYSVLERGVLRQEKVKSASVSSARTRQEMGHSRVASVMFGAPKYTRGWKGSERDSDESQGFPRPGAHTDLCSLEWKIHHGVGVLTDGGSASTRRQPLMSFWQSAAGGEGEF